VEKPHRNHRIEVIVGEWQARGVAAQILELVVDASSLGSLAALLEHRCRDVEPDDVGPTLGEHGGEPTGATRDFEHFLVFDRRDRV
jgi:hypothetical protein